jgi:hypothetical protein
MYNIVLVNKTQKGDLVQKIAFHNMSQYDASKAVETLNRINCEAAKMLGKTFNLVFKAVKNG